MSTQHRANTNPVRIHADHAAQKRLGDWTTARAFEVCARHAQVVIDLRSPQIPDGEIQLNLDLDHTTLTLLVADGALIDHSGLTWTGRGKVKQTYHDPAGTGRRIQLTGQIRHGEVRVHSGGIARSRRSPRGHTSPTPAAPTPRAAPQPCTTRPAGPDTWRTR
jgi:hypothetical protein